MMCYPTEADLNQIKALGGHYYRVPDIPGLVEMLKEVWHFEDYVKHEGSRLELHTGGWSGNEDIIEALQDSMFWVLCWQKSERGGHYYFELRGEG